MAIVGRDLHHSFKFFFFNFFFLKCICVGFIPCQIYMQFLYTDVFFGGLHVVLVMVIVVGLSHSEWDRKLLATYLQTKLVREVAMGKNWGVFFLVLCVSQPARDQLTIYLRTVSSSSFLSVVNSFGTNTDNE